MHDQAQPKLGIHRNLREADYRAADGINISLLKPMELSPLHCRQQEIAPREQTQAMLLGSAFHAALLQPLEFHGAYFKAPGGDRRTREGKAAWAEALAANPSKTPLKADEYDWIEAACEALWARPDAAALLGGQQGLNELSAFWEWQVDGQTVRCKGRIDRLTQLEDAGAVVVDVKTVPVGRATPGAFPREVAKYAYHAQAAYYRNGLAELSPRERGWLWLVVENEPPFAHAIYEPMREVLAAGQALYERWLARYVACAATNDWPGYPSGVQPLDLPAWAYQAAELDF